MARGKDGYGSLLGWSAGGECDELVTEEDGILISTMLRQYFMSLTVLAKWKRWGPCLDRHWYVVSLFLLLFFFYFLPSFSWRAGK